MGFSRTKVGLGDGNTDAVVVHAAGGDDYSITCYATLDGSDASVNASAGTATLTVKLLGSDKFEPVYQSDGVTPESFDLTDPESRAVSVVAAYEFKVTPASLDAGKRLRLAVST